MFLALAVAMFLLSSATDHAVLHEAEAAFRQGTALRDRPEVARTHFRRAAEQYEELRTRGIRNAALFRNQGNAWLRAGDGPRAILAYRRGLRLTTQDAALHAGLALAREQVVYPAHSTLGRPRPDHWPPWLPRLSATDMFWLAVGAYGMSCAALVRWFMLRRRWYVTVAAVAFGAAVVMAVILIQAESSLRDELAHPLVVFAEDGVLVRSGNGWSYPARFETPLNRGVEARLRFAKETWLQVELANGEVGWVPRGSVLLDEG